MPKSIGEAMAIALRAKDGPRCPTWPRFTFLPGLPTCPTQASAPMQFHQGHRDERRRRALVEDQAQTDSEAEVVTTRASRSSRRNEVYAPGAKPENQHRITDLVPTSYVTVGLWFFGGLLLIVALAAGHLWMPRLASAMAEERLSVLELGAPEALGCWFASLALGMASIFSLVVYSIQRHKVSDYRGHYRWWLLAAAMWLVMSMDSTAAVHDLFRVVMTRLSGYSAPARRSGLVDRLLGLAARDRQHSAGVGYEGLPPGDRGLFGGARLLVCRPGDRPVGHANRSIGQRRAGGVLQTVGAPAAIVEPRDLLAAHFAARARLAPAAEGQGRERKVAARDEDSGRRGGEHAENRRRASLDRLGGFADRFEAARHAEQFVEPRNRPDRERRRRRRRR